MGKYIDSLDDIYSIFGSAGWLSENIKTIPTNGSVPTGEFIRINIVGSGKAINRNSSIGVINIEIFIKAGFGPKRSIEIADKLDSYLSNKSISMNGYHTQLFSSTLSPLGIDSDNSSLYRYLYSIPFNHFRGT